MPRRQSVTNPAPRRLTDDDHLYIDRVRQCEADIRRQELAVAAAAKQLREQRVILNRLFDDLRCCAAALPLFEPPPGGAS